MSEVVGCRSQDLFWFGSATGLGDRTGHGVGWLLAREAGSAGLSPGVARWAGLPQEALIVPMLPRGYAALDAPASRLGVRLWVLCR